MGEHNHDCQCGCGCDHDHEEAEELFVTLTLEDGSDVECEVVAIFPAGDKQYIAVTPAAEESEDLYFFRLEPDEEDEEESILVDIEDEAELDLAANEFEKLLKEAEEEANEE